MNTRDREARLGDARASGKTRKMYRFTLTLLIALALIMSATLLTLGCGDGATDGATDGAAEGGTESATAAGPEMAVQKFLTAMENKDIDAIFELMGPQYVAQTLAKVEAQGLTLDDLKQMSAEGMFPYDSIKFSDIKLKTTETGEGEAVVTIVEGSYTQTADGATETMDATDSDLPPEIYLVQMDGEWYIDFDAMGEGD